MIEVLSHYGQQIEQSCRDRPECSSKVWEIGGEFADDPVFKPGIDDDASLRA